MGAAQSQVMVLQMRRSCEANTQLFPKMRDQLSGLSIVKKDLAVRLKGKRYERRTESRPLAYGTNEIYAK
jgi:hypothetical protein